MVPACLMFVLTIASATPGQSGNDPPFQVPAPPGWARETIALPPDFARNMKWKGVEELRFAPNWMKAHSDTFFSYALLFWLPEDTTIDAKTIERELLAYYRGLAKAVLQGKHEDVDFDKFTLAIHDAPGQPAKRPGGERVVAYAGELKWTEPFTTVKPQTLRLEIHTWPVKKHKHHCLFICASPQPETAVVWKALREIREGCTFR